MEKIKVFLSDQQVLFREDTHFVLSDEEDFDVIGEATNNRDALAAIEGNLPNVAILNMGDGPPDGAEATRQLKRDLPSVSVILITDNQNEDRLFLAMKCGASACITKDIDPDQLIAMIKEVARGSQPIINGLLIPGLADRVLAEFEVLSTLHKYLNNVLAHLSPQETEILRKVTEGNSVEQVAAKLGYGEDAVRYQLQSILQKLVANDQTHAIIEVVQRSLPSVPPGSVHGRPATEYVTKREFTEFREGLMQNIRSLIGELTGRGR